MKYFRGYLKESKRMNESRMYNYTSPLGNSLNVMNSDVIVRTFDSDDFDELFDLFDESDKFSVRATEDHSNTILWDDEEDESEYFILLADADKYKVKNFIRKNTNLDHEYDYDVDEL